MSDMSYTERAKRGAILLDGFKPGWFEKINLDTLQMDSLKDCILGQIYGDWDYGADAVGMNYDRSSQEWNGFELTECEYDYFKAHTMEGLRNAWSAEVLDRMA